MRQRLRKHLRFVDPWAYLEHVLRIESVAALERGRRRVIKHLEVLLEVNEDLVLLQIAVLVQVYISDSLVADDVDEVQIDELAIDVGQIIRDILDFRVYPNWD